MNMKSAPIHFLLALAALAGTTTSGTAAETAATGTAAEASADAEAKIHIKYNAYLRDVLYDANAVLDDVRRPIERSADFVAKRGTSVPDWRVSRDSFEKLGKLTTRVPNWLSATDVALFRDNIDQLKTSAAALLKLSDEQKAYFAKDGPYKADEGKKFTEAQPAFEKIFADIAQSRDRIRARSYELSSAAETRLAASNPLGSFLLTLREDLAKANDINALFAPLTAKDATPDTGKKVVGQVKDLLKEFKERTSKNATRSHRELIESVQEGHKAFYTDCADFVKNLETNILPELETKGTFGSSSESRLRGTHDNIVRSYNKFVTSYNYKNGGNRAIER
jgi:gas vesicle protein